MTAGEAIFLARRAGSVRAETAVSTVPHAAESSPSDRHRSSARAVDISPAAASGKKFNSRSSNKPMGNNAAEELEREPPACCDEKSQCQIVERTHPGLQLGVGHITDADERLTGHRHNA